MKNTILPTNLEKLALTLMLKMQLKSWLIIYKAHLLLSSATPSLESYTAQKENLSTFIWANDTAM